MNWRTARQTPNRGRTSMARTANTKLDSRSARARLAARAKPYNLTIGPRRMLGYVRISAGAGRWLAIVEKERSKTGSAVRAQETLGVADDIAPANGDAILTFAQALALAG